MYIERACCICGKKPGREFFRINGKPTCWACFTSYHPVSNFHKGHAKKTSKPGRTQVNNKHMNTEVMELGDFDDGET